MMCGWGVFNPYAPQLQARGVESRDLGCRLGHRVSVMAEPTVVIHSATECRV